MLRQIYRRLVQADSQMRYASSPIVNLTLASGVRWFSQQSPLSDLRTTSDMVQTKPTTGKGRIELICGPMFSGKTTELIRRVQRQQRGGRTTIVIKHMSDQRYTGSSSQCAAVTSQANSTNDTQDETTVVTVTEQANHHDNHHQWDEAVTHDLMRTRALATHKLSNVIAHPAVREAQVVGVDEGQFFPDLAEGANALANAGKVVIVAALDGTFRQDPFPATAQLLPLCERVDKLQAVCRGCGEDASFSVRLTQDEEVHVVGGAEMYQALCRSCTLAHCQQLKNTRTSQA